MQGSCELILEKGSSKATICARVASHQVFIGGQSDVLSRHTEIFSNLLFQLSDGSALWHLDPLEAVPR